MTNLTIDSLAATLTAVPPPVPAPPGVDFDAILDGLAAPATDAESAVAALPLPGVRQVLAGTAPALPTVTLPVIDLPEPSATNFWIALEASAAASSAPGSDPTPVASALVRPQFTAPPAEAAPTTRQLPIPATPRASDAAAIVTPGPATLECGSIAQPKGGHKPASILFETTALHPPALQPAPPVAVASSSQPVADVPVRTGDLAPSPSEIVAPIAQVDKADQAAPTVSTVDLVATTRIPVAVTEPASAQPPEARPRGPGVPPAGGPRHAKLAPTLPPSAVAGSTIEADAETSRPTKPDDALGEATIIMPLGGQPPVPTIPIVTSTGGPVSAAPLEPAQPIAAGTAAVTGLAAPSVIGTAVAAAPNTLDPAVVARESAPAVHIAQPATPAPVLAPIDEPRGEALSPAPIDLTFRAAPDARPAPVIPIAIDARMSAPVAATPVAPTILPPLTEPVAPTAALAAAPVDSTVVATATLPPQPLASPVAAPNLPRAVLPPEASGTHTVVSAWDDVGADDDVDSVPGPAIAPASTTTSIGARAIAPAGAPAVVDTTRIDWIEALVDRIDDARANTGHRSAHIRLLPDALGTVDVRIRHDGDRVSVTVTADNPQARAMLAEAAPRLVELAESRGLRLGESGIDQGRQGQRSADQQQRPSAPPNATVANSDPATDDSSERIA